MTQRTIDIIAEELAQQKLIARSFPYMNSPTTVEDMAELIKQQELNRRRIIELTKELEEVVV
jgi:hypothetical protein